MTFKIEEFAPAPAEVPYLDAVDALIDAGEGKALTIEVELTDNDKPGAAANRERVKFQKAANHRGYTARVRGRVDDEKANTAKLTFTLGPRENRGPKRGKLADVAEGAE